MQKKIDAIIFDKGGTLSMPQEERTDKGIPNMREIMGIIGYKGDVEEFRKKIRSRDKFYKDWGSKTWIELSEEDIWTKFLLPDYPVEKVLPHVEEISLLFSHSKGDRQMRPDAVDVVKQLKDHGYKIGILSNTVSRKLVPGELEECGMLKYTDCLFMSSITGIRKPDPRVFHDVTELMGIDPLRAAYIGDQPVKDVEGPRRAGYGLNVLIKTDKMPDDVNELPEIHRPDILIHELKELLGIFPPLN